MNSGTIIYSFCEKRLMPDSVEDWCTSEIQCLVLVTDMIGDMFPYLNVGPSSVRLTCIFLNCTILSLTDSSSAVLYRLHERLLTLADEVKRHQTHRVRNIYNKNVQDDF